MNAVARAALPPLLHRELEFGWSKNLRIRNFGLEVQFLPLPSHVLLGKSYGFCIPRTLWYLSFLVKLREFLLYSFLTFVKVQMKLLKVFKR